MSNFTIKDMLAMQQALQEKYKDKWEAYGKTVCSILSFSNKRWYYYCGKKNDLQKVTNIYGMTTVWLRY